MGRASALPQRDRWDRASSSTIKQLLPQSVPRVSGNVPAASYRRRMETCVGSAYSRSLKRRRYQEISPSSTTEPDLVSRCFVRSTRVRPRTIAVLYVGLRCHDRGCRRDGACAAARLVGETFGVSNEPIWVRPVAAA